MPDDVGRRLGVVRMKRVCSADRGSQVGYTFLCYVRKEDSTLTLLIKPKHTAKLRDPSQAASNLADYVHVYS